MSLWEKKDGIRESRFLIVTQQIVSPIHLSLAQIIKSVFTVTRCHFSPVTGISFQTEGTGMISCDCGPLVCVKAADSFLVCMCFRQMEKWEKSTDTVTYYINGLNSPHVCNLTVGLLKVKILWWYVIIVALKTDSFYYTATDFTF